MTPYAARSHPGLRRSKNEDNFAAEPELGLWVVADGVGGHSSGEVAARIACEVIRTDVAGGADLSSAIEHAHRAVLKEIEQAGSGNNMGTTVVVFRLHGQRYEIAWVGDSRAYLYNGKLQQLTRDHSTVNELLDSGAITEAQAADHPQRHALSRSLGVSPNNTSTPSVISGELHRGEQVLLCTDGLTDELRDAAILNELRMNAHPQAQVDALLNAALAHGGSDNVTVVLVGEPSSPARSGKAKRPDMETTQNIGEPFRHLAERRGWSGLWYTLGALVLVGGAYALARYVIG